MKKIYISGPMTGIEGYNASAFYRAEKILKEKGFETVNPFVVGELAGVTDKHTIEEKYFIFMKADIIALMECDSIFLLNDWPKSKGSVMERQVADFFGMGVYFESDCFNKYQKEGLNE